MVICREANTLWYLGLRFSYRSQLWDTSNDVSSLSASRKGGKNGKGKAKQVGGDGFVWQSLFDSEETITPKWIICRLGQKDKYRDEDTRMRLARLLIVEGILCPTSGSTQLRPEVLEMVGDMGSFMEYL